MVIGDDRPAGILCPAPGGLDDRLVSLFGHFPTMKEVEEYVIGEAMKRANGNQGIAASLLGTTRQTINRRLQSKEE